MPPINRIAPAVRRLRIANSTFQQPAFLRSAAAPVSTRLTYQARYQQTVAEPTTSASSVDHAPQSQPSHAPQQIKYTADAYPNIQRDSRFKEITAEDIKFFRDVLGSDNAIIDGVTKDAGEDLEAFNSDWMKKYRGQCKVVLKPDSTQQVSKILKYCNDNLLPINPQGGNTGLVGGSVPVFDEIVLNLSRMNTIHSFDDVSGILVADAGVILQAADDHVAEKGYIFPLDLGAKGSCQIGGNVATNAGGL
ncbi:hypothetical protein KC352_g31525, partial [Hortaea werneckii]